MFVLYILIMAKIVAMRYKVFHAKQTFNKNDQVLVSLKKILSLEESRNHRESSQNLDKIRNSIFRPSSS